MSGWFYDLPRHEQQAFPYTCWWACIKMVSRAYGAYRARPEHWNHRFAPTTTFSASAEGRRATGSLTFNTEQRFGPVGVATSEAASAIEGAYGSREIRRCPPNRWMDRGIPPHVYGISVLCDLFLGRLSPVRPGNSGPGGHSIDQIEEFLDYEGPLLGFGAFPWGGLQSGDFHHVVMVCGVDDQDILCEDPARPDRTWRRVPIRDAARTFRVYLRWNDRRNDGPEQSYL